MTTAAALFVLAAGLIAAAVAGVVVDRRRRLGLGNPAFAWLALCSLFFGVGSIALAIAGRPAPAAYTGGAMAAFAAGLIASDRLARRRGTAAPVRWADRAANAPADPAPVRPWVVALLTAIGLAAVAPTLVRTGLPFLVPDITGARAELAGLPVQILRVALPAAAIVALGAAVRPRPVETGPAPAGPTSGRDVEWRAVLLIVAIASFEVLLASRYLLAELGASLVLAWLLAGRRVSGRIALAGAAAALVAFAGIQLLRAYDQAKGREVAFVAERTVNRVVLVQPQTLDALMTVIPAEHDFFLGATWARRLAELAGRDDVPNLGYWIYPRVVGGAQATAGYAAPGWLGEAWANFGWASLAMFALLGAAVERLAALVAVRRSAGGGTLGTADLVAAALTILFVARTHALGVAGLAVVLVVVLAWRLLAAPPGGLAADVRRVLAWRS